MGDTKFSGGVSVKASTLNVGDTIRNPHKSGMIMVVESGGSQIYVRGYEQADTKYHFFIPGDTIVTKVTNASTETTKDGIA